MGSESMNNPDWEGLPRISALLPTGRDYSVLRQCLDTKSGDVLWQGPARTGDNVMFLSIPGHVVALVNDGQLHIISSSGGVHERVASYRVAEHSTWAPPVLLQSGFLVKGANTLTMWSFPN